MSQTPVKGSQAQQGWARATARAFGQNLGQAIARRSLTLSEAGRRIGVSHATVSTWASGKVLPEWPNMAALCVALNISLSELFEGRYDARPIDERIAEKVTGRLGIVFSRIEDHYERMRDAMGIPDKPHTPPPDQSPGPENA